VAGGGGGGGGDRRTGVRTQGGNPAARHMGGNARGKGLGARLGFHWALRGDLTHVPDRAQGGFGDRPGRSPTKGRCRVFRFRGPGRSSRGHLGRARGQCLTLSHPQRRGGETGLPPQKNTDTLVGNGVGFTGIESGGGRDGAGGHVLAPRRAHPKAGGQRPNVGRVFFFPMGVGWGTGPVPGGPAKHWTTGGWGTQTRRGPGPKGHALGRAVGLLHPVEGGTRGSGGPGGTVAAGARALGWGPAVVVANFRQGVGSPADSSRPAGGLWRGVGLERGGDTFVFVKPVW